jgi:hypothetical protein
MARRQVALEAWGRQGVRWCGEGGRESRKRAPTFLKDEKLEKSDEKPTTGRLEGRSRARQQKKTRVREGRCRIESTLRRWVGST